MQRLLGGIHIRYCDVKVRIPNFIHAGIDAVGDYHGEVVAKTTRVHSIESSFLRIDGRQDRTARKNIPPEPRLRERHPRRFQYKVSEEHAMLLESLMYQIYPMHTIFGLLRLFLERISGVSMKSGM